MLKNRYSFIINAMTMLIVLIIAGGLLLCKKKPKSVDITTSRIIKTGEKIPLKVTHISPIGSVEGYRETFKVLVGFNQAMVALQPIPRDETKGPLEFDPPIKGKYRWMGSRTLAFIPADTLQPATRFTVTLNKDKIQSLTGMKLKRDTSWTFESIRPQLLSSIPYQGSRFIDIKRYFYLKFNIKMDPGKIGDNIKILAQHGIPSYVYCGRVKPTESKFTGEIPYEVRHLKDYEKKDWPLKNWENEKTLVLVPGNDLPKETKIKIILNQGLVGGEGNLGLAKERVVEYNTYNFFRLLNHSNEISGDDPLKLCFSNPLKVKDLVKNLKINPEVKIPDEYEDAGWGGTQITLYLPFKTNTTYQVEISKKLLDKFENPLDRDYRFTFKVGDYLPNVDMPTGINLVESNARRLFPVTFTNVDRVNLKMGIVPLERAVWFLKKRDVFSCYRSYLATGFFTNFAVDRAWFANTFKKHRNKKIRLPIRLDEVLGSRRSGLVFIQLDNLGQRRYNSSCQYQKAFLEVGNLGVTWKYAPENNVIFISRLDNTEPISNAKVQFRTDKNQILWEGYTDDSGFCDFPGWAEMKIPVRNRTAEYENEYEMESYSYRYEPNFWLTVSKGGDQAVYSKNWNFGIDLWRFDIPYRWQPPAEEYSMFIFTEKGLYKSGEDVHIKGVLRKKSKGRWILPDVSRVHFVVSDSRDEEVVNDTLTVNRFGAFIKEVELTEDAVTGVYSIKATLLKKAMAFSHYFRVEAYKPAEFEVKVSSKRDTFIAEEQFEGTVTGRYLFGMPMTDADCSWTLYADRCYLNYPEHKGYRFGYYEDEGKRVLGSGKGKTGKDGGLTVKVKLSKKDIRSPQVLTLEGTVTAPNKRSLSGRQNWPLFNGNLLVGLKTSDYLYIIGDTVKVGLIAVRPSGVKVKDKKIEAKVVKREWKSIKKARTGGRYEWVSEMVDSEVTRGELKTRLDSTIYEYIPDRPGYYYCDAVARDEKGRKSKSRVFFYVAGRGYCGWEMRDDDIVELVADKDLYQVGDTARILVKSPYDSTNALITVERELVLRKWRKKIRGNAAYIEVPIKSIDLPNVYVGVMLFRGRTKEGWDEEKEADLGKPQFKIGYINLKVDSKEKHLKVMTWSDTSDYRPRDSVSVFFNVKNYKDRPVKNCEVALFVVDVGVLNLIGFQTPDPFRFFYGSRSLYVKTIESRLNIIGERSYGEKGEERGGGGAPAEAERGGVSYRQKFIATVFYKGNLRTDRNGNGQTRFQLPDNLTKFRIMAVAQTKNSEFGSGDSTFRVNLPFIVTASIPRFLRVGDEFKAGVVLHNRTKSKNKASVDCQIEGLKLIGDNRVEVDLPPDGSKEVRFPFTASEKGSAVFKFKARMGEEQDALKLTIPVINPPFIEAVATFSSTPDSALEGVIIPEGIYEGLGGIEFLLSSSILAGMQRGIEHLLDYPYGCLEQRLSRILPLIVGEEIINQFKLAPVTGQALRDTVQKVIDDVPEYQLQSGGFVFFKGSVWPSPYLSAYTMYVLKRAEDAGYKIDYGIINRGKGFLRDVLNWRDVDWTYPYNVYDKLATRSFCVYSLAIWGDQPSSYASRLFEKRDQLPIFGKTLLLKAGRYLGMGKQFEDELARMILNKVKMTPTTAHFEESENRGWTFPSPAKVTAYVIQTFTELDLNFPYKDQTLRWLVRERTKRSLPTTHENAFVFDAFQTYYKKYEKEEPDFVTRILLNEHEILKKTFKGRTNKPPEEFTYGLDQLPKGKLLPVRIIKQGKGRLYYVMRMRYALKESPIAFDEGFYLWKEVLTLNGKGVNRFKRGEVYKVILHVVVPETRLFAAVDDPLPSGFVPVQTFFATESRAVQESYWQERWRERGHWWGGFDHRERYNDRMLFFAQRLFPGEHTLVYFVRAATGGRFLAPSTKAEEMYSPEVFGSTGQRYVVVE